MKNTMKKIFALGMTALVSVGMFAGCGGGKDNSAGADGKIEIKVSIGEENAEGELMSKWKQAYEAKNDKVKIKISTFSGDYNETMMGYAQSPKQMPDIMWTTGETHAVWSKEGIFVNLKDMIDADASINLDDFYGEILSATRTSSKDDGIYFMPRDYNKPVLFINKVMFKKAGFTDAEIAGLKDGWNYEKFLTTCEKLRAGLDKKEMPLDAKLDFNASYCSFIKHYGGEIVENGKVNFLSNQNVNAYSEIYNLIDKGYIADSSTKASTSFTYGMSAMMVGVRPQLPDIPATSDYDIDFLSLPLEDVGVGCSGYAITSLASERVSNSSYNADGKSNEYYAFDFLKFIVSEEGQKIGAETGSIIPVRKSMANDTSWTSYMNAGLNHAAFISAPEKDFSLSMFQDFTPDEAATISESLAKTMAQVLIRQNYANGTQELKNNIQQFQNAVKDLKAQN